MPEQKIETEKAFMGYVGIRWGAIFGGWMFAYAFAMLLYLLGAAVGVTSLAVMNGFSKGVTISTGAWMVFAWVAATYIGALFAGRSAGVTSRGNGMMHGVLVWALSGIMTLFIGSAQASMVAKAGASASQGIFQIAEQKEEGSAAQAFKDTFQNEFKTQAGRVIANSAGSEADHRKIQDAVEKLDAKSISEVTALLTLGDVNKARATLAQRTKLSENEVNDLAAGLSESIGQYGDKAGQAVEQAGDFTSAALWVLFLSSLLGLGAGAWGGAVGASLAAQSYGIEGAEYIQASFYENEEAPRRKTG